MFRIFFAMATVALVTACTTTPTVTKQRMTLGEANIEGLECRREKAITTNVPRTICASPEAWARYDKAALYETSLALQAGRSVSNVGRFNRD